MSVFPTLTDKPNTETYSVEYEDPSMKNEMEGGYVVSRPRFTRTPRRIFKFGYTFLKDDQYQLLEAFWKEVKGGSKSFTWLNQFTGETITVRFEEFWKVKYVGRGSYKAWDVTNITLKEV